MACLILIRPPTAGPQLDLPHDATPAQLETLLNGLLQQTEKLPYSFFIEEQPLTDGLGAHLHKHKVRLAARRCLARETPLCFEFTTAPAQVLRQRSSSLGWQSIYGGLSSVGHSSCMPCLRVLETDGDFCS